MVAALDGTAGRWVQLCRFRWPERESTMRALGVVVLDVASQDRLEVAAAEDEEPVETLGADGADEPLGVGVGSGCAHGRGDDSDAFAAEHLVEPQGELAVAVVDQEPHPLEPVKLRLRACWVTQAPLGLVVQPANWTRRLPSSM